MEQQAYHEMHANEDTHWWFVARRRIIQKVLNCYFQAEPQKKILEVGCGSGGNLSLLKKYGTISAMELNDATREIANNRQLCHVEKGELPNNIPYDDHFDLICILDVLEHIDQDTAVLLSIKDKLKPDGKLLITVPAYKFLWSKHDLANHHKRRYLKKQLVKIVAESGLHVQYATYFNTCLFPIIALVRILNNFLGKKSGSDIIPTSGFSNRLLTTIFSCEAKVLPRIFFPFGVSILLIAEKKGQHQSAP